MKKRLECIYLKKKIINAVIAVSFLWGKAFQDDLYIAEDSECFSYWPDRYTNEIGEALANRKANRSLPFDVQHLKASLVCRHEYVTVLRDDGRLLSVNLERGHETEAPKDVSQLVVNYSKDETHPDGMTIKWYGQANLPCYFLFE